MLKRLMTLFVLVPIAIVVITLAVTNRQPVTIGIPPHVGDEPFYSFTLPLFVLVFVAVLVGMFIGSFATWLKQGKHRKRARQQKMEATKWHVEADKEKERAEELARKVASTDATSPDAGLPVPTKAA